MKFLNLPRANYKLVSRMKRTFEYVIKVNGKEVWRGLNPTKAYFEIKKKYPKREVSIAWRTKEKVLVCIL
jgi:hypothetical protein